jgi:choline dehydrogenase-like flavoprotein
MSLPSEVDAIVVGAGSAGAVVAARLSEDPSRTVVLIESGPDYTSAETPPAVQDLDMTLLSSHPEVGPALHYPKLTAIHAAGRRAVPYLRGRGVGGSSAINGLFAIRPTVEDLDEWAALGLEGWSYTELLPLLCRLENDLGFGTAAFHGDTGPLPITRPTPEHHQPLDVGFAEAAQAIGHKLEPDHNAPGASGVSPYAFNALAGRRVSTNDGYLEPARSRSNLVILGSTTVDRVLVEHGRAVGVRAVRDGEVIEVRAAQVVLSAGAVHTPTILLRSGIGPAQDLRGLRLPVVADLPVGVGLQDHAALVLAIQLGERAQTRPNDGRHSRFCLRFDLGVDGDRNDGMIVALTSHHLPGSGVLVGWVNRVESRGAVRLASVNPFDNPVVALNMLDTDVDRRRMRRVADELQSLARVSSVRELSTAAGLADGLDGFRPTERTTLLADSPLPDDEFVAFALRNVTDTQHAASGCVMGTDPSDSVVDAQGRVHGVEGLRVADASIFPWVPRANTHLVSVLTGEKIARDLAAR